MCRALIVLAACGTPATATPAAPAGHDAGHDAPPAEAPGDGAAAGGCEPAGDAFEPAALAAQIAELAAPALDGRAPGTAGDRAARALIAERLRCLGIAPAFAGGAYEQRFAAGKLELANLAGVIAGSDPAVADQVIVVGAHYDHLGDGHLGANDNASGVAALLAIAQALHARATPPRRTILLVAFGGEEAGELGSQFFAAHPPRPLASIVQDINLDMVGSYRSRGFVAAMGTFAGVPARALIDQIAARHPRLDIGRGGHGERSDHEPFCTHGIPYVFFWTPDTRCYHERCDTADRIDLPHLVDIAEVAAELVGALADTKLDLAAKRGGHC